MSWLTRGTSSSTGFTSWSTGNIPAVADWNAIGLDLRTWGGNVDAGSNSLSNLASIIGVSAVTAVTTILSLVTGSGESLWFGVHDGDYSWIQATKPGVAVRNLCINASGGFVGIGTVAPKSNLHVTGLPTYASNAAAIAGGLTAGAFYTDGAGNPKVTF